MLVCNQQYRDSCTNRNYRARYCRYTDQQVFFKKNGTLGWASGVFKKVEIECWLRHALLETVLRLSVSTIAAQTTADRDSEKTIAGKFQTEA